MAQRAEEAELTERRAAFASLARQHEAHLLRAARRMAAGDADSAQDLVQDTLVAAYEAYVEGRFASGSNVRAWLFRILTNRCINVYRRKQKWEAAVDLETLTGRGGAGPEVMGARAVDTPDRALLAATLDEPLERALAALSREFRVCVVLVDMEQMEYADAALALGIPIGTLRSRLARARLRLHSLLFEYARDHRRV
jgi:RNA polymerase sigma-70 factor, ECF subfamily